MRPRNALFAAILAFGCSDDGGNATDTGVTQGPGTTTASAASGDGSSQGSAPTAATTLDPSTTAGDSAGDSTADTTSDTGVDSETGASTSDTGVGSTGPVLLYEGPVVGGAVPDWNPDDPRALVMFGQLLDQWVVTLARIDADGNLSDNATPQIVVWGWETEPPQLYDGPVVGGTIPGWSAADPTPVVMAGYLAADDSWTTTLASIGPDGSLGDNLADRILVWGWSGPVPGAPSLLYSGALMGGQLDGWNPAAPEPLVMLARFSGEDTWQSTLVSIGPEGEFGGNIADELQVWGW